MGPKGREQRENLGVEGSNHAYRRISGGFISKKPFRGEAVSASVLQAVWRLFYAWIACAPCSCTPWHHVQALAHTHPRELAVLGAVTAAVGVVSPYPKYTYILGRSASVSCRLHSTHMTHIWPPWPPASCANNTRGQPCPPHSLRAAPRARTHGRSTCRRSARP
jgi:hypothetical protein